MSSRGIFDVVIPAGGEISGDYAHRAGTPIRALAPIGPEKLPVLQIVVNALRSSGKTGTIIVVGPEALKTRVASVDLFKPEQVSVEGLNGGPANVLAGLRELEADRPALVCTSDLPFLTGEAVADFVDRVDTARAMSVALIAAERYENRFAGAPPSEYVRLSETGPVTMAGMFCLRPDAILDRMPLVMRAFTARKSQWSMVSLLGPRLVWQFTTRRLSVDGIRRRVETLFSCDVDVATGAMPETAFDIDTVEDYLYAHSRS